MKPSQLIDEAGCRQLEATIREVEAGTEGELRVVVVPACDAYADVGWRVGVTLAVLAYLGMAIAFPPQPFWLYLVAQAFALLGGHGIARIEAVRRALLPRDGVDQRLGERARRAFAEYGLAETRARSGVLILVTTLERRVIVLGDQGIDDVLDPDESWQQVVALAVEGLHDGRAVAGLDAALRRAGEILTRHFPTRTPRMDQLPNTIIVRDDL